VVAKTSTINKMETVACQNRFRPAIAGGAIKKLLPHTYILKITNALSKFIPASGGDRKGKPGQPKQKIAE
jgi:hypothetical protein